MITTTTLLSLTITTIISITQALTINDDIITGHRLITKNNAPPGNYRESCRNIQFDAVTGILTAECLTGEITRRCDSFCAPTGRGCSFFQCSSPAACRARCLENNARPTSSINLLLRECNSGISNEDGQLRCNGARDQQINVQFFNDNNQVGEIKIEEFSFDLLPLPELIGNMTGVNRVRVCSNFFSRFFLWRGFADLVNGAGLDTNPTFTESVTDLNNLCNSREVTEDEGFGPDAFITVYTRRSF
eukprot:Pgem_evm1s6346